MRDLGLHNHRSKDLAARWRLGDGHVQRREVNREAVAHLALKRNRRFVTGNVKGSAAKDVTGIIQSPRVACPLEGKGKIGVHGHAVHVKDHSVHSGVVLRVGGDGHRAGERVGDPQKEQRTLVVGRGQRA